MSTDAFVAVAASVAPSLVQSVAAKANPVSTASDVDKVRSASQSAPTPAITKEQVQAAVQQIQKYLTDSQRTLEFRIDEASDTPVVTVRDANGDLIRQIPSAETLHIAQILKDQGSLNHGLLNTTV